MLSGTTAVSSALHHPYRNNDEVHDLGKVSVQRRVGHRRQENDVRHGKPPGSLRHHSFAALQAGGGGGATATAAS